MSLYAFAIIPFCIDVSYMFPIYRCIHRNRHMIKEGQKIQRRDKTNLKKYRRQEEKTRDKDRKTTLTLLKP